MNVASSLNVKNISCLRSGNLIFADLSFALAAQQLLILEGANGSGKSSLLRIIAGLLTPDSGEIFWNDQNIAANKELFWRDLHFISHANGLKLELTLEENLKLTHAFSAATNLNLAAILQQLNLRPQVKTLAKFLSAGQKRRLALARLLLQPKKLWILDEPCSALDSETQKLFLHSLTQHIHQGGSAIISTHQNLSLPSLDIRYLRLMTC